MTQHKVFEESKCYQTGPTGYTGRAGILKQLQAKHGDVPTLVKKACCYWLTSGTTKANFSCEALFELIVNF